MRMCAAYGSPDNKTHQDYSLYEFLSSEDEIALDERSLSLFDRKRVHGRAAGQDISNKRKIIQLPNAVEPTAKRLSPIGVLRSVRSSGMGESESCYDEKHLTPTQTRILDNPDQGAGFTNTKDRQESSYSDDSTPIQAYLPNLNGSRSHKPLNFTSFTSTAKINCLHQAELQNDFSSDTSDNSLRDEILLPTFLKIQKNSDSMNGDIRLDSLINPEVHPIYCKLNVPCISIAAKPQDRSQAAPLRFDTGGAVNARSTRPLLSKVRIVDKLSRPERGNLRFVHQDSREGTTEIMNNYPMASRVRLASRNGREMKDPVCFEEHGFSYHQLDIVPLNAPDPVNIPSLEGFKIKYSRQRSHLRESDVSKDNSTSIPIKAPKATDLPPRGYSRRKTQCHTTPRIQPMNILWDETNDSENTTYSSIKSIHELREAGGNARIVGEMEAILDDIDSRIGDRPSLLCKFLVKLAMKLEDPMHCQLLVSHGLETRLIKHINSFLDPVTNILLMTSCLCLIVNSCTPNVLTLMTDSRVLDYLSSFLGRTVDDASSVLSDFPNFTQVEISDCFDSLSKSPIWKYGRPIHISTRFLALQCLDHVARHVRDEGDTTITLSQAAIAEIIKLAVPTNREICYDTLIEVQLTVSILESITLTAMANGWEGVQKCPSSMDRMAQLLPAITTLTGDRNGELHTSALRLCLNFTNNNQVTCEAFAKTEFILAVISIITRCFDQLSLGLSTDSQRRVSNHLILALGLLINIAEWSERAREIFLSCDTRPHTPLDILLHIFNANIHRASEVTCL